PVDVIDHDDDRPLGGERLEQASRRPEQLLRRGRRVDGAGEREEAVRRDLRIATPAEQRDQTFALGVRVEVGRAELAEELHEWEERDALAVGEAAAAEHGG